MASKVGSNEQIGGSHYKNYPIQPGYYAHANNLGPMEFNVVKYVTRHKGKAKAQDIHKAIHCLTLLLEWEYPKEKETWKRINK